MTRLLLSTLPHTWLIDLDGTVMAHNGQEILSGVAELWRAIPAGDTIILLTARPESERASTLECLNKAGLRHDHAIFALPVGERILINDEKPGGLKTALAVNVKRNHGLKTLFPVFTESL
jgi:ribonucleotide monophosphatase NagD (HAD superfamily)